MSSHARACSTPVYRYAMYNWAASPFVVCYLHRGEPAAKDEALNQMLQEASIAEPAPANVVLEPMNLEDWKPERLPPRVREVLQARAEGPLPAHVVLTPWGAELPAEQFDKAAAEALIGSPIRTRVATLLEEGHAAVFLFVPGRDAAENEQSETAIRETIAQAASGQFPGAATTDLGLPPGPGQPADVASEDDIAAANRLELAMVKLDRSEQAEQWLVRTLMHIEPDLYEYEDEPMVFAIYGRGRSMEPYIGKGITVENLCDLVAFLTGACSCMVKEQNPGVDLLFRWNWEATADRMAENDPTLTPPWMAYQEYPAGVDAADPSEGAPPEESSGVEPEPPPKAAEEGAAETAPKSAENGETRDEPEPETARAEPAVAEQPAPSTTAVTTSVAESDEPPGRQPIRTVAVEPESPPARGLVTRQMWTLGLGAVMAAVVVLTAGLVLLRRRSQ